MNDAAGRLSEDELLLMARLLKRFCEFDLDQWDHWIVGTSYGDVFIDLGRRRPPDGVLENVYNRLPE